VSVPSDSWTKPQIFRRRPNGASLSVTSSAIKKSMSVNCFTQEPFGNVYGGRAVIRHANFNP
jgi:hypothetical protein